MKALLILALFTTPLTAGLANGVKIGEVTDTNDGTKTVSVNVVLSDGRDPIRAGAPVGASAGTSVGRPSSASTATARDEDAAIW